MSPEEYIDSLETNAMILGVVVMGMTDFANQIIRYVHKSGVHDDSAFAEMRDLCIRNLKDVEAEGVPLRQEAKVLNEALRVFRHMMNVAEHTPGETD